MNYFNVGLMLDTITTLVQFKITTMLAGCKICETFFKSAKHDYGIHV